MNRYDQRVKELKGHFLYAISGQAPVVLSEEDLQSVESVTGFPLPCDYREFLRDFGGYSFWADYAFKRTDEFAEAGFLGTFLGLKIGGTLDLIEVYKNKLANQSIGPELLPIAHDAAGNPVCLFLSGPWKNRIYFSDAPWSPYDYDKMYHVADSFDEFMRILENAEGA